jgi:SAM-dependent methyltransferase
VTQPEDGPWRDWHEWYRMYDDPQSLTSQRLAVVREWIRLTVEAMPPGPVRTVSICAGDGRDLGGALAEHPRRGDVRGLLVEIDPELAERGRATLWPGLDYLVGDAARTDSYLGAVPADLVLACGIFGNIGDDDIAATVRAMPAFLAPGGTVIWTRHRGAPDMVPTIDGWFADAGFARVFVSDPEHRYGVGVHRLVAGPEPLAPGGHLFTFVR